jgi:hypothetical protein
MPSTNGHGLKRSVLWAILYARVSTDEQARSGYSLAQQLEALREYAAREGYEVLEEVQDPGQSGARASRWKLVAGYTRLESGVKSPRMPQRDGDRYARTTTAIDHPHRPPTQDAGASEAARNHYPKARAPCSHRSCCRGRCQ